jgi:hypothetical protein
MKSTLSVLAAVSTLALLSACGGSGDSASPPTGTQSVAITSTNQTSVARATVNGGLSLGLVQNETTNGAAVSPGSVAVAQHVLQRALSNALNQRKSIASAMAKPATGSSGTDPCGVSGTLTSTWNDVDNNSQLSAGDILTANFQHCQDTSTLAVNGLVTITLTGTPSAEQFSASASFQSVAVVYGGITYTINGAVALSEVDTSTVSSSTFTIGSPGLTVAIASASYDDSITFDSGFVAASTFLAGTSSLTVTGSFVSQSIGGRVTIATPQALIEQPGDLEPRQGQVLVTGAGGSTLLATVLNTTQVQLQVDANGDGTIDGTTTVAWSALLP